ncbi:ABC transporter substrate-binding protein [Roseixanthobacter glucoisosaccharinicivorans]|uniref:ABC transporter substrate-binding protein n=1 Tax=Roseixanthobacter glucoisosaccharinicivorans TaxID=3119923 RepID=UPI00372A83D7
MRLGVIAGLAATSLLALTAAQAADGPVRIGVLNDQSGLYSEFGGVGSVEAAKMAVEDFGGKVLGRPIEILSADHQNKTDVGAATARKWFDEENVLAIADLTNSAVALAVQGMAKERGRITLASGPATTRLTNEDCSPTGFHWPWDTYSQAVGTARAVLQDGGKSWYLVVVDYAFGHQMSADISKTVTAGGGTVLGQVRYPTGAADFSSFLLQAQGSKAQIIGLANGGMDTINSIKQAAEFGITDGGQRLVGLAIMISDVNALGLKAAKGLIATTAYYWDRNDASRAFGARYMKKTGRMPDMIQAGVYSSVLHYLKAMQAANSDDGKVVAEKMREMPVNDFFVTNGKVRADGRMEHDMYLIQVKDPSESKYPWDYYKILRTIPAAEATMPLSESKCPLVKK